MKKRHPIFYFYLIIVMILASIILGWHNVLEGWFVYLFSKI